MFSSSLQSVPRVILLPPHQKHSSKNSVQVRAQSMRDEGRPSNLVDSNMKVLKDRIEQVRVKERLIKRSCTRDEYGWNYAPPITTTAYNYKHKKQEQNLSETLGLAVGISGLAILSASALLCLVSIMAHFHL